MRSSHLLVLAVLALSVVSSLAFIRAPIERVNVQERSNPLRRYYSDPMNRLVALYTGLINIGGSNYRVILDTGSSNTYLIASGCTVPTSSGTQGCQFATNFYSGTGAVMAYDSNQCESSITFNGASGRCGTGSVYADESYINCVARTDNLVLGAYSASTAFGAAYDASHDFIVSGTDGIWGMGRPNPRFRFLQNGPLGTLFNAGMPKQFAMCMTSNGGDLHLGGYDSTYSSGTINWFTFDTEKSHYQLPLTSVSVGSTAISSSSGSVIFDSGSTFGVVPNTVFNAIVSALQAQCGATCTSVFTSDNYQTVVPSTFPDITLSFTQVTGATVTFTLTGSQYLWQNPNNAAQYTGGFSASGDEETWLFGQSFMRNWYTIFDIGYGVVGIGNLASGKCTASLTPTAPLTTLTPSTPKPPASTGGITQRPDSPATRPPIAPTPATAPAGSTPPIAPGATPPPTPLSGGNPTDGSEPNSASTVALSSVLVVLALVALFY